MEEQKKDKTYLKKFLKSPSIQDQIAGFKQKLEDARSNLTVRTSISGLLDLEGYTYSCSEFLASDRGRHPWKSGN
jgi:hypothetical protein